MTVCCPLESCDERATLYSAVERTARKQHTCYECRGTITKGQRYEYISMLFDGRWNDSKLCLMCREIGDHFSCGGRILGQLWSDLEENFFPDMKAGGPCMEGLSPAAKQFLIDRRMEWYLNQDE